ncbi:MAG TPA: C25 family cysteine peptidase, partial [Candidatus Krumholzibacteria bacterium]|nr:C25 family cysteine peptidase [Candidatus Krumholzibacteria bacterium]
MRRLLPLMLAAGSLGVFMAASTPAAATELSFPLALDAGNLRIRATDSGDEITVSAPGYALLADAGRPALPYRIVNVVLPPGEDVADATVRVLGGRIVRSGIRPLISSGERTEDGIAGVAEPLAPAGASAPFERVRFLGSGRLHGYTIASFAVFPVSVDDGNLGVAESMVLDIDTAPSARAPAVHAERRRPALERRTRSELARLVINPGDAAAYSFATVDVPAPEGGFAPSTFPSLEGSPVDYVIVTPDSLAAAYQTLADFKTAKGVPTVIRTVEWILANYRNGSDAQETIRNFVRDAYTKWGITYLLLGGDTDQLAPRLAWSGFYDGGRMLPVDMYFGCLDGEWNDDRDATFGEGTPIDNPDLYAEVYVGRLPTSSTAEVAMAVGKIISYETPVDVAFGNRVLLLGEVLFPINWTPPNPISVNGADLTEVIYNNSLTAPGLDVVRMYETEEYFPGSLDENRAAVLAAMNTGFNHVVHIGHGFRFNMSVGDASIQNADADALVNGDKLSCLYFLNCTGASYTYYCLAEHFLRNPNGGAVSVIGANESAFPNVSSAYMNAFYDLVFDSLVVNVGEAFARSRESRTPLAVLGDNVDLWTHYIYTLLADPEMPMWTGSPVALDVTHVASVGVGKNYITVTAMSGGNPVEGARVCLTKGGDDYAVGTTNGSGQVVLPFRARSAGAIDVVVTGTNLRRNEGSITVTAAAAYVQMPGMTVDDDNLGGTVGNGDGVIDGGETVDLTVSLKNTGSASTGVVTALLRSNDGGVSIGDSTAAVGVIAASQTIAASDPLRVTVSSSLADAHPVPFTLIIKNDGSEAWRDEFKREVHQPALSLVQLRIDDAGTGNGNGVVDAGEQFKLFYKVKNFGSGVFPGGTVQVTDLGGGFTFVDSLSTYPALAPLASAENATGFTMIEPGVAIEHQLQVEITDIYGRATIDVIELRPPVSPTALVVDPSLGVDRLQVSWTTSVTPDVTHYNIYRSLNPGGPFVKSNLDPVANAVFLDTGLAANTLYYYRAAAIDASGNESAQSATMFGSTNPAQLAGFPIGLGLETGSSPAVGDLDGDGMPEIVVCANKVFAFHSDGNELIDGDSDPQSWGVLSAAGSTFVSHPALARIDATPGLEIVAASRDLKSVYVFNYQGTILAGWPKSVENTIRAGLVVGDLDGDNVFEIIAVDEKGVIYAWNDDGSEYIDGDSNPGTIGVFYRMSGCTFNYSTPAMADIDNDNMEELIVGSQGDQVYVFNQDGSISPGWPYALGSDIGGNPVVADVDNNGDMEIIVNEWAGSIRILNHDGTQLGNNFFSNNPFGAPFFRGSPAVGNVTGDAKLEIFVPRGSGYLYGMQYNGVALAGWPQQYSATTYTESSPVIADINADGVLDIVLGDETRFIHAWSATGAPVAGFPLKTDDAMRGVPQLADVDLDGDIDLVAAGWDENLYVWDFMGAWDDSKAPWPRFQGNTHNNGQTGFVVPTPVGTATFSYIARDNGVDLVWAVPPQAGGLFTVSRAEVTGGTPGRYEAVARGVALDLDGLVRLTDRRVEMGASYVYRLEGEGGVVSETMPVVIPVTRAKLGQNFPNPFNPVTKIEYWVAGEGAGGRSPVSVVVYD